MHLKWYFLLLLRFFLRTSPPSKTGSVQQQPAFYPVWSPWRSVFPVWTEARREPLGLWLQVSSAAHRFNAIFNKLNVKLYTPPPNPVSTTWCTGCVCTQEWSTAAWSVAPLWNTRERVWRSTWIHTTESVRRADSVAKHGKTKPTLTRGTRRKKHRGKLKRRSRRRRSSSSRRRDLWACGKSTGSSGCPDSHEHLYPLHTPRFCIIKTVCIRWRKYFCMCCFLCIQDIKHVFVTLTVARFTKGSLSKWVICRFKEVDPSLTQVGHSLMLRKLGQFSDVQPRRLRWITIVR